MVYYLYDPTTNISTESSYKKIAAMAGVTIGHVTKANSLNKKIGSINCYVTTGTAPVKQRYEWYSKEQYKDEFWLDIVHHGKQIKLSNYGRVKQVYKRSARFLMPFRRKQKGNLRVKINSKEVKISHLVADNFIRRRLSSERVLHKNGIITDDFAGNLEIVTQKELGMKSGRESKSRPVVQIDASTCEVVNEYRSTREAARYYYMNRQSILDRCTGKVKQTDGYIWAFTDEYIESYL